MKDALAHAIPAKQAWNAFVAHFGRPLKLSAGLTTVLSQASAPDGDATLFRMDMSDPDSGTRFAGFIALTEFPFAQAAGADLQFGALGALSEAFRRDILSGALEHLRAASGQGGLLSRPVPVEASALGAGLVWVAARLDGGWGAEAGCVLGAERAHWELLAQRLLVAGVLSRDGQSAGMQLAGHIPLRGRFSIARMTLSAGALRGLDTGDILMPQPDGVRDAFEGAFFCLTLERGVEASTIKEITVSETEPETTGDQAGTAPDVMSVPVTLSIVTGEREMTLAELGALSAGAHLPLEVPEAAPGSPVRLLANGRAVGTGHLVQIDGALAVRVSGMFGKG